MDPYSTQMMIMNQIGQLSGVFIEHVRSVLFALAILIVGLIVSEIAKYAGIALLRVLQWDRFCAWIGLTRLMNKVRADVSPSHAAGTVLFWFLMLTFFMKALERTDLAWFSRLGDAYFEMLPKAFHALLIMAVALVVANWLARLLLLSVGHTSAFLAASMTRTMVIFFGLHSGLLALGWERSLVQPVVLIMLSGTVLAIALTAVRQPGKVNRRIIRVPASGKG